MREAIPSYYRIMKFYREQILAGVLKPGDKLPTESELCKIFQVSRVTVRAAMEQIERSGLIVREQAKGTFVAADVKPRRTIDLSGEIMAIVKEAKKYNVAVIDKVIIPAPEKVLAEFNMSEGDLVYKYRRVRMKDNSVFSFVVNYLPIDIGKQISVEDLEGLNGATLIESLKDKCGIVVAEGEETIEARNAFDAAEFLQIKPFDPVLYMWVVQRSSKGKVVNVVEHYYRGDRYKYKVSLK